MGIFGYIEGRGCIGGPSDVLMSLSSDVSDVQIPTRCPCQGWGPLDWRKMLSKALMQMWEPRCAHVSRSLAWGTLDQDNTSCLVQGIPALKRTLTWCHWDPWMQRSSKMHYFLCICLFDGNPCVLWPIVIVLDLLCCDRSNGQCLYRSYLQKIYFS